MDNYFEDLDKKKDIPLMESYRPIPSTPKKNVKLIVIISVIATIIFVATLVGGIYIGACMGINSDMPMLVEAYELVKKYYYQDIDWKQFQELAAASMTGSVDNFTGMINIQPSESPAQMGINISSNIYNEHFVSYIIQGSPSYNAMAYRKVERAKANIQGYQGIELTDEQVPLSIGDKIYAISIDGGETFTKVENAPSTLMQSLLNQALSPTIIVRTIHMIGFDVFDGTQIHSVVEDSKYFYDYYITRNYVQQKYAYYYSTQDIKSHNDNYMGAGMIKLTEFSESACLDFSNAVEEFKNDPAHPTKLILDLRNNGGGDSRILGFIAKYLLNYHGVDEAPLLMLHSNKGNGKFVDELHTTLTTYEYEGQTLVASYLGDIIDGFEVAVLVNGGTASSSEVLTHNLMYYNNSKVIGSTTYGKGVAQKVLPLSGGKYHIYITNGYYYLPTDNEQGNMQFVYNIHGKGINASAGHEVNESPRPYMYDTYILSAKSIWANS